MIDIRKRLLVVFQAEAKEHLARIRAILSKDGVATAGANLDEAFRRAHSLKGAARAVDLRIVELLAHPLETLFQRVREGALKLNPAILDVIHQALDGIEDGVATQISGQTPAEPARILQAIEAILNPQVGASEPGSPLAPPAASIRKTLEHPHPQADPHPEQKAQPNTDSAAPVAPEVPLKESASVVSNDHGEMETVRVSSSIVERLHRSVGQMTTEGLRQSLVSEKLTGIRQQLADIAHEWELVRKSSAATLRRMETHPEMARLSRYIEFVEHRVAGLAKESRDLALLQKRSAWSLKNIGDQLQQDVCGARMILADNVFDSFGKMIRDVARDEGKEIDFRSSGMDVQADRLVLQALKDPIMHILRNTIAHGIETPAERKSAGKSSAGNVSMRLATQGNQLLITIEDDGRGVDIERVTKVAIAKGLMPEAAALALSPEEKMRLIFHPGISTTRTVTELAGRGMGLNIVSESVARLQGTVSVAAGEKSGTVFTVAVPLAISSCRLLLVKCGDQRFAIPTHAIESLQRVKTTEIVIVEDHPTFSLDGRRVAVASLARIMKSSDSGVATEGKIVPVAILKSGEKRLALAVDAFISEMEGVIKDLSPVVMKAGNLSGGILMGDGSVVLVLNPADLVESFRRQGASPLLKEAAPVVEKRVPVVLVVDDSMTTRTLEKSILEAHGYRVLVAVDGQEALTRLRGEQVDLIVSDVEMPRLDGFGLLQEVKKDVRLAKIPLILVTSLEKREDKERGLALGADGYIVKRKFDQKTLLDTVRQML